MLVWITGRRITEDNCQPGMLPVFPGLCTLPLWTSMPHELKSAEISFGFVTALVGIHSAIHQQDTHFHQHYAAAKHSRPEPQLEE